MGQHKKVRSLPPLEGKKNKKTKDRSQSLNVQVPDRQRIIGSPAPQAYREINERKSKKPPRKSKSQGDYPTITLSAAESEDEDYEDASQMGSYSRQESIKSSLSMYSISTVATALEKTRLMSAGGLTPPPRVVSLSGQEGHQVHTEWQVPGTQSLDVSSSSEDLQKKKSSRDSKEITSPRTSLPALTRSSTASSRDIHSGRKVLPNKYPTLDPIKGSRSHGNRLR